MGTGKGIRSYNYREAEMRLTGRKRKTLTASWDTGRAGFVQFFRPGAGRQGLKACREAKLEHVAREFTHIERGIGGRVSKGVPARERDIPVEEVIKARAQSDDVLIEAKIVLADIVHAE